MNVSNPFVSIVVTSYTMERFSDLTEMLGSLDAQTYRNFEIILVVEKSLELYDKLTAHVDEMDYKDTRVLFNYGPLGLSPARNLGIREARGGIIAFTDDDALAFPDWLERIVDTFARDQSIIGVTGSALPLWEDESMRWFPEEFYWIFGCTAFCGLTKMQDVRNVWGADMAFTREAFEMAGLFNEDDFGSSVANEMGKRGLIGDDTEFSHRVRRTTGKRIVYNPDVRIWHKVYRFRLSTRFIWRYSYQHAYSKAMFRHAFDDSLKENTLAREYELLKRIFLTLLPSIGIEFFRKPGHSWRRLLVTSNVLVSTAFGYFIGIRDRRMVSNIG